MIRHYQWNEFDLAIYTESEHVFMLIEKYTSFDPQKVPNGKRIRVEIHDRIDGKLQVPPGAEFLGGGKIQLEEVREYRRYQKGWESWRIYEGYGAYQLDVENRRLVVERNTPAVRFDYYFVLLLVLMPLMELLKREGFHRFHAGCVDLGGHVSLLAAESGGGKSTATFALLEKGHVVLSDEMPLIRFKNGEYEAVALSDTIKIREDSKERFFNQFLCERDLEPWKDDWYLRLRDIQEQNIDAMKPIRHLFVLRKTGLIETKIHPIHPTRAVPALFPVTIKMNGKEETETVFTFVMDFLNHTMCHEVAFGTDMDLFVQVMEDYLNDQADKKKD